MSRRPLAWALAGGLAVAAPLTADDLAAQRRLYEYDATKPVAAQLTPLRSEDGVAIYDLLYPSPIAGMVTGFLVAPEGGSLKPPFAGIVFGHWGPGDRSEFLPEAILYAQAGAVSVLIDYPWVRPEPHRRPQGQGFKGAERDRESWVQAVVDLRRAFDLLEARKDVDRARLGYVGHSYGAQWGAILSAVDKRMKATVLMGGVPDGECLFNGPDAALRAMRDAAPKEEVEAYWVVNRPYDAIRYIGQAAPVPLLFQFARHETSFTEADMKRYFEAASAPKEVRWYETGHILNDLRTLADRAGWLGPRLGLRPLRPVFEKRMEAVGR